MREGWELAVDAVASWNGGKANALRRALRMTNEQFAEHLGVAVRTVAYWRRRPDMVPRMATQEILDAALARASEQNSQHFWLLLDESPDKRSAARGGSPPAGGLGDILAWASSTNVSDQALETISRARVSLAQVHIQAAPSMVLSEVLRLHEQTQALLQGGRQKLRQTRELMQINSDLLAHACLLLGDLGQNDKAEAYGDAALLFAREAAADEAKAWSARAKTARWRGRFAESANMASRGFEVSGATPTRIELAYREAIASALAGDASRSREALERAERSADCLPSGNGDVSVWSFPVERRAVFRQGVAIQTGDPATALQAAAMADAGWAAGDPRNPASWAQIRIGSAMAYLMKDALDGAVEQVIPVLDLHPSLRIDTVTGYLQILDRRLGKPRFARSKVAAELRQHIREFNSAARLYERNSAEVR
jgi:hypothetical protein